MTGNFERAICDDIVTMARQLDQLGLPSMNAVARAANARDIAELTDIRDGLQVEINRLQAAKWDALKERASDAFYVVLGFVPMTIFFGGIYVFYLFVKD